MKKILSLILTLVIAVTITACGKKESTEEGTNQEQSSASQSLEAQSSSKSKVLVDNDLVKITFKETSEDVDDDVLDSKKIIFELENKSGVNLNITANNLASDGHMINSTLNSDLPMGEKTRVDMRLYKDEVTEFKNIEGNFYIRNTDENKQVANYNFELFEKDNYFSSRAESEVVIIDNDLINVKVVKKLEAAKGEVNSYQGPSVRLEVQNKTSEDISINPDDVVVAGQAVKVNTYFTVPKNSTLKENIAFDKNVQTLDNIEGKIKVSCKEDVTKAGDFPFKIE